LPYPIPTHLLAKLGISKVQQGAQLFGVKLKFDFLVARSAEFLLNEVDDGTYLMNVLHFMMPTMAVFLFQHTNGHDIIADGLGIGVGVGVGVQLFFFTGTKRGVVIVQQRTQTGCIVGMHCAVLRFIHAQLVLHNVHERAQFARVQMGFRNHDGRA